MLMQQISLSRWTRHYEGQVGKHIIHSWKWSVIVVYIRIWKDKKLLTWWDNELRFCISCIAKFCIPKKRMITRSLDLLRCKNKNSYNSLHKGKAKYITYHVYIFWVMLSSVILLRRKLRSGKYFRCYLFFRHLQLTNFGSVSSKLKTELLLSPSC